MLPQDPPQVQKSLSKLYVLETSPSSSVITKPISWLLDLRSALPSAAASASNEPYIMLLVFAVVHLAAQPSSRESFWLHQCEQDDKNGTYLLCCQKPRPEFTSEGCCRAALAGPVANVLICDIWEKTPTETDIGKEIASLKQLRLNVCNGDSTLARLHLDLSSLKWFKQV